LAYENRTHKFRKRHGNADKRQAKPQETHYGIASTLLTWLLIAVERFSKTHPTHEQNNGANYQIAEWTRKVGIWTRRLVYVGFLTAAVLGLQLCILRQTDETFRAGTRAFVISYELIIAPVVVNNDIAYWKVAPIIANSGNSATIDGRYYLGLLNETPTPPIQLHWNEIDPDLADVEFSSLPTKITLGPKAHIPGTILIVTKDQAAQMRDGTLTSYIFGEIFYRDTFNAPHQTYFCHLLLGSTGKTGNIGLYGPNAVTVFANNELSSCLCRRNNCADNECGPVPNQISTDEHPSLRARKPVVSNTTRTPHQYKGAAANSD
jgi:hypothetical protein